MTRLPPTVIVLSLVSFFNDMASDMVIPLIPLLLAGTSGGGAVALGLVEGVADAVAAWLKLWAGRHSDLLGGRRKVFAVAGYSLSNAARPMLAVVAGMPVGMLLFRSIDRIGKGIRSAPRDAMIADVVTAENRARAYGFHRAMDNGGAVAGALLAALALVTTSMTLPQVLAWSVVPGVAAVLLLVVALRDPPRAQTQSRATLPPLRWRALSRPMRRYLLVLGVFTLARASETFLVLRGHELDMGNAELLVMWAALNLAKALVNTWGGAVADRLGRYRVMLVSWGAFAVCYIAFSMVVSPLGLWLTTLVYGVCFGIGEGAERAVMGEFASATERGTAFGWYNMMLGIAAIPAGITFGLVWHYAGAPTAFLYAALLGVLAVGLLHFWVAPIAPVRSDRRA